MRILLAILVMAVVSGCCNNPAVYNAMLSQDRIVRIVNNTNEPIVVARRDEPQHVIPPYSSLELPFKTGWDQGVSMKKGDKWVVMETIYPNRP